MKVKEISNNANITWSPEHVKPIYLACGTSAQQLDASFNSSSLLQLYDLSPQSNSLEMKVVVKKEVPSKFNKLLWHGKPVGSPNRPSGIIVGGCDNGSIYLYSPDKLLKNEDALITSMEGKHAGPVYSLDFNHHQHNLLATGSSECEIFIWDINDTSSPMTPGTKPNMASEVTAVAWNRQVEHIMASTYAGRCVVYDLRKSSPIIQIAESVSRIKAHSVNWHPNVATQLILGCDDDSAPFAQVWDLRFAAAPLKSLEGHQRGIVATAWSTADPDLFLTSGKDNKIYIWNPNNTDKLAEVVGEFPSYNQWSFDVTWCHKDPSLVASASVDGTVSVYSVLGAGLPPTQNNKFSAIADSFPGMEMPVEVPQTVQPQSIYLRRPPKWFPKRCGARFGFGGRLVSWGATDRNVTVSQVITEPEFVSRSSQLEEALSKSDLGSFCKAKAEMAKLPHEKTLWKFIEATFEPTARSSYMSLLGFTPDQVALKVRPQDFTISPEELANRIANLGPNGKDGSNSSLDPSEQFEMIASAQSLDKSPEIEPDPGFECLPSQPMTISVGDDAEGLIRHSLLVGDYESAVQLCLKEKKNSLALILSAHAGPELFNKTRDQVLKTERQNGLSSLVTSVVQRDIHAVVTDCSLSDWKEALIFTLTYASDEEFSHLIESLGERLEADGGLETLQSAVLCYLCSGNLDKFASCLAKTKPDFSEGNTSNLQDLIEIMVVLEKALASVNRPASLREGSSASIYLCKYASLLASQGALSTAVSYLNNPTQGKMMDLRDRLYRALGYPTGSSLSARNRTVSASSHHSYRRSSTPQSYQPPQYTPSVQAQQASYGAAQTSFYGSTPSQTQFSQQPSFMQTTATVAPSFGGNPISPPNQFQPLPPPTAPNPTGPPPTEPPTARAGFRRTATSGRYAPDPSVAPGGPSPLPPGGMFTPSMNTPSQAVPPNSHFPTFNPASTAPAAAVAPPMGMNPSSFVSEASEAIGSPMTPAAFNPSLPRGWNDPPPLSASRKQLDHNQSGAFMGEHSGAKRLQIMKAKQRALKNQSGSGGDANPAPLPGVMVPEPPQPQPFSGFPNQSFGGPPLDTMNKGMIPGAVVAPQQIKAPEPPPPKAPLPPEHQIIQEVFNRLREKGLLATVNPSAKQRLEDLNMKLEILYDKLRNGQIGSNTISGLHQIVNAVKSGDYHRALQLHSSTITSGNFSEMSQFMPAVKMLLTTCMQCQVFYN